MVFREGDCLMGSVLSTEDRLMCFAFKNQHIDVRDIGKKLDVNYLVEDSLSENPVYSWHTAFIKTDPIWDPLRNETRFKSICKKLGIYPGRLPSLIMNRDSPGR
jgi:hypothetical protein